MPSVHRLIGYSLESWHDLEPYRAVGTACQLLGEEAWAGHRHWESWEDLSVETEVTPSFSVSLPPYHPCLMCRPESLLGPK